MTYAVLEAVKSLFAVGGRDSPTTSKYSEHLSGTNRLCVPMDNARFYCAKIANGSIPRDAPITVFRGKAGSYAYLFFRNLTTDGRERMERVASYYNCSLEHSEKASLPFFGATFDDQIPVHPRGERWRLLEETLTYLEGRVLTEQDLDDWEARLPYSDAPFCVQSYYLSKRKLPEFAGLYLDSKGLPLGEDMGDFSKCTFPMKCDCIDWKCDRERCRKRKYGIGSPEMSELELGELTQYQGGDVFYVWRINGKDVRFEREIDIMRQERFLPICMRQVGVLPHRLSNGYWLKVINKALRNMKVVGSGGASELTIDRVRKILTEDFRDRTLVATYYEHERLMQGWIYIDPASSSMVIEPDALCSYVRGVYPDLRIDGVRDFKSVLRHLGFRGKNRSIDGVERVLWYMRTEFLFDDRETWKEYMLHVSEDTMWEQNFRAFLTDGPSGAEPLDEDTLEEIDEDAAIFLDTEKGDGGF